jgi:predicted unusual protein kinase regulating ubiquinone biosynthesis (AarF/ABC1/UbiB family)
MVGGNAEDITLENQLKTAEQLFTVLGGLKGGAMKFGQALSIFEAVLPEEIAGPYRQSLTKLQDSAPPMSNEQLLAQMARSMGPNWRDRFQYFDENAVAAASIGQVHKAIWRDGREVAVKVQYPGAAKAVRSDLNQIGRLGRVIGLMIPGLDVKELVAEFKVRLAEELDYLHESKMQRKFAVAYDGHPDFVVPHVLAAVDQVMVTEWVYGRSLARVIESGTPEERNHFGQLYLRFILSGPTIAGALHADPQPGNFLVMDDGRMAVLDFGATSSMPDGMSPIMGTLLRVAMSGNPEAVVSGLRREGFIKPGIDVDPQSLLDYLAPFTAPTINETFAFGRGWLREQFERTADPRNPDWAIAFKINLPPNYMLIHRAWIGSIGVLCQLGSEFAAKAEYEKWVPGFVAK